MLLKVVLTNGEVFYKDSMQINFVDEGACMPPLSFMDSVYKTDMTIVPFRNVLYIDLIHAKEE